MKGYKIVGEAEHISSGKWLDFIREIPENNELPTKGDILIKVNKIIHLA